MRVVKFEEAMGQIDDKIITDTVSAINGESESGGFRKRRHVWRTLLIAAVIVSLFTVSAFAIGFSIHQKRQAELRQALQIDSSNVTSYIEYETPETDKGNVTILSAIRDGKFQKLYVNISPVEKEDAEFLFCSVDGVEWSGVTPFGDAYDKESKTLTVECSILLKKLEGMDSAELRIAKVDLNALEASGAESFGAWAEENGALLGTARFTPTQQEMRFITFTPTLITDELTGREVTVLALELSPTGIVWHLSYDGAEELYNNFQQGGGADAVSLEMLGAEDYVLNHAALHFSDGTSFAPGAALTSHYADGAVLLYTGWEKAVDINALESVTVGDTVLPII